MYGQRAPSYYSKLLLDAVALAHTYWLNIYQTITNAKTKNDVKCIVYLLINEQ